MITNNKLFIPLLLAVLIVILYGFYYHPTLPIGELKEYDEYHTLDRSNAFLVKGDWLSVYSNFEPNFKKPPLQYWLTAHALANSDDLEYAVRVWPFIFGLGLLMATGFLAYALNPLKPYVIPISCLVLSGFPMLWVSALSAMLDTGAAFFLTLTLAGTILAIRKSRWWFFVAITVWLSALQKAPIAIFCLLAIFFIIHTTRKYHDIKLKEIFANKNFRYSMIAGVLLVLSWPLIQMFRFGPKALAMQIKESSRFTPVSDFSEIKWNFFEWIWQDAFGLWVLALVSLIMLPRFLKKPESFIFLLLVSLFIIMLTIASGGVYARYLLLIIPVLTVSLATTIAHISSSGFLNTIYAFILIFVLGTPLNSDITSVPSSQSKYKSFLINFSKALKNDELPLYCKWGGKAKMEIYPGALSYYATNGRGFINLRGPDSIQKINQEKAKYRGLCHSRAFEELKPKLKQYEVIEEAEGFVHWKGES